MKEREREGCVSKGFPELAYELAENGEGLQVSPDAEPLDFLLAIMRDPRQPMARRLRAATDAAQYRHPKLGAVATLSMDAKDFAAMLERAVQRSRVAPSFQPRAYLPVEAPASDEHS
jgi:hypothetical protein